MFKWLNKLHEKNKLYFALLWTVVYIVLNSAAIPLSAAIGAESSAALAVNAVLSALLFFWLKSNGLTEYYGLCRVRIPASRFLFYIPLVIFMSRNLWFGFAINFRRRALFVIFQHAACRILEEVIIEGCCSGRSPEKRQNRDYHNKRYLRSRAYIEFIQRQRDGPCREYLPGVQRRWLRLPVCDNFPSQRKSDSLYRRALGA